ncbi:MAG: lysine biosynthesis protein LysX [Aigarchaeota archaeon]|nr:lysine biosynthesis protein LysX [Aigarchaeota archaeon]MDW8093314.1 lysine biosynthesis protein LysX [Nitrososphaerota archaeon]
MARISVFVDVQREEERLLIDAARRLGHELEVINVMHSVNWIDSRPPGEELGVSFVRCISQSRALAVASYLHYSGVPTVNNPEVLWKAGDKLITLTLLSKRGIRVPETAVAYSRTDAIRAAERLGYPVVIKPIHGSWGRYVMKAHDPDSLDDILDLKETVANPTFKIHLIQRYIEKPGRDIRAFYLWGEVPVAIYRVSESWKTNTARGARAVPAKLDNEVVEVAVKAGDFIGGGVLGIDLMEDREGEVYVSEVNGIIEFRNTVRVTNYDLPAEMIERSIKELRR